MTNSCATEEIYDAIRKKYTEIALSAEGKFKYPAGRKGAEFLGYDLSAVNALPDSITGAFCGVGNPFGLGVINHGEKVLDIGCGAGFDLIVARTLAGPEGHEEAVVLVAADPPEAAHLLHDADHPEGHLLILSLDRDLHREPVPDLDEGALRDTSFELLGMAHRLAADAGWNADSDIKAVLLGYGVDGLANELASRGAAEVIYAEAKAVEHYTSDAYRRAIEAVVRDESPELILVSHTPNGWDVAPLVAGGLGVPLATGCSNLIIQDGKLRFPVFLRVREDLRPEEVEP